MSELSAPELAVIRAEDRLVENLCEEFDKIKVRYEMTDDEILDIVRNWCPGVADISEYYEEWIREGSE